MAYIAVAALISSPSRCRHPADLGDAFVGSRLPREIAFLRSCYWLHRSNVCLALLAVAHLVSLINGLECLPRVREGVWYRTSTRCSWTLCRSTLTAEPLVAQ